MAKVARRYASANRPTMKQLYAEMIAAFELHNAKLFYGEKLSVPSYDTFARRIKLMDAFKVHAARWGVKRR